MTPDLPTRCREAAERLRPYWGEVGIEPIRCLRESADEIERLRDIVRQCRKHTRLLDAGNHAEQSWSDFCADTERMIAGGER